MFNFFKEKCPICKMDVKDSQIKGFDKKFCSEECKEEYEKKVIKKQPKHSGGCCH